MSLSGTELKSALRKSEFPFCAREALSRVEQLIQNTNRPPSIKHLDLAMDLMAEFIFCEIERRGGKRKKLSCIQELQLLEVLCDYFTFRRGNSDTTRNSIFMYLFPPANIDRCRFLAKLVSMAISTKNTQVLCATGVWMQQVGCTSKMSTELVRCLVKDYFVLLPKAISVLQDLPQLAPHFTANFLTSVAEMYGTEGGKIKTLNAPPSALLQVISRWISENPMLCLSGLQNTSIGVTGNSPTTPFAGLFKWCVLSPLYATEESAVIYSLLHLALLESLLELQTGQNVVSTQQLQSVIVEPLLRLCQEESNNLQVQQSLDRLSQAVQVLLAQQGLHGNLREFMAQLEILPENRSLQIIIKKYKTIT